MNLPETMLTLIDTVSETVKQSLTSFAQIELKGNADTLSGKLVSDVSEGLAASLHEAARAGLKEFIEQFECEADQIEREGCNYRLKDGVSVKTFLSMFGEIELVRRYYHCSQGGAGIVPLDEAWDMQGRYAAPEVVENVLWISSLLVPGDLAEACQRLCAFNPSISCIQDIISCDGAPIASMLELEAEAGPFAAKQAGQQPEPQGCLHFEIPEPTEVFVASLDGANVLLREKGAKPGRPKQRPGLDDHRAEPAPENGKRARQSPSSYKNAMVGSFSYYKRVDGVLDIESGLEGIVPERLHSHYCARMPEEKALGFKEEFEVTLAAIEKEMSADVTRVLLIDGARPLWKYIEQTPCFKGYRLLLDFFHASEHLSHAAEALFGKDTAKAKKWHQDWRFKLKYEQEAVDGILRSITYYQKTLHIPKSRRKDLERETVFFQRNKTRMNYPEHVANGWPIGSGPVEAACKTIVKARLCQSGMRWSRKGGRNILALRVLNKSHQWDQVWKQYHTRHWRKTA
jgi:hypothetical protein